MFYGGFVRKKGKGKPTPVMRGLHKQISEGRHRFKKHVHVCFEELFSYFDADPDREDWLCDGGVDEVPNEYLALVEKGFRAYHPHVFAMGQSCMTSREAWQSVHPWRKREAYIAMARHVLKRGNYRQWDCFSWADYQERQLMARTFTMRHLPLSNGEKLHDRFVGYLEDPKSWDESAKKTKRFVPKREVGGGADEPRCENVMVFDVEKQMLVPLV